MKLIIKPLVVAIAMVVAVGTFANGSDQGHNTGNGHRDDTGGGGVTQIDSRNRNNVDINNRNTNRNSNVAHGGTGMGVGIGGSNHNDIDNIANGGAGGRADSNANSNAHNTNNIHVGGPTSNNTNNNVARGGDANQDQRQNQRQKQAQGQSQGINSKIGATGSGNTTNVSYSSVSDTSDTYKKYTPSSYAAPVVATTPCYVGMSAGIGVPGFSGSVSAFKYDEECEHRETVRLAQNSDNPHVRALADQVMAHKLVEILEKEQEERAENASSWSATWSNSTKGGPNNLSDWH